MTNVKQFPTRSVLVLPGHPVKFETLDCTIMVTVRQQGSCLRIDYETIKRIPPLLENQRN